MNFFLQKKNIILITAIITIILGGLAMVPAMSHAFGPWILKDAVTNSTNLVAFIFIIVILMALTEIILGAALCTKKWREKLSIIIPLFTLIATKLVLLIISTIIFGIVPGSSNIPFYVLGFIFIAAALTGFIYSFCLMNERFSTKIGEKRTTKAKPKNNEKQKTKNEERKEEKKEEGPIHF